MSTIKINNFAKTALALGCTNTDLTLNVADASVFPSITGAEYFYLVLEKANLTVSTAREIVKCTAKAANALTVVRAQEGTTALAWDQGDRVALRLTAGTLEARIGETEASLDTRLDAAEASITNISGRIRVGEIIPWPVESAPDNFLEANGAALSRITYAGLFSVIGTRYGGGDGVTTFNIPDYRGEFLRGWDHGTGRDPDAATRTARGDGTTGSAVGTRQADQFKSHNHAVLLGAEWVAQGGATALGLQNFGPWGPAYQDARAYSGGNETRGRNVAVMWCIRYA